MNSTYVYPGPATWDDDIDINDLVPDFKSDNDDVELSDEEAQPSKKKSHKKAKQDRADKKAQSRRDRRLIESLVDQNLALSTHLDANDNKGAPRFQYRETSPQAFGLSSLDILAADDTQLNQWAGLKKLASFRDAGK